MKKILMLALVILACGLHVRADLVSDQAAVEPTVLSAVAPVYPPIAAQAHAMGEVVVQVRIDSAGAVSWAHADSGHPLLQAVCTAAARRWTFAPIEKGGAPRTAHLTFVFINPEKPLPNTQGNVVFYPPFKIEITRSGAHIDISREAAKRD